MLAGPRRVANPGGAFDLPSIAAPRGARTASSDDQLRVGVGSPGASLTSLRGKHKKLDRLPYPACFTDRDTPRRPHVASPQGIPDPRARPARPGLQGRDAAGAGAAARHRDLRVAVDPDPERSRAPGGLVARRDPAGAAPVLHRAGGFPSDGRIPITVPIKALAFDPARNAYADTAAPTVDVATITPQTVAVLKVDGGRDRGGGHRGGPRRARYNRGPQEGGRDREPPLGAGPLRVRPPRRRERGEDHGQRRGRGPGHRHRPHHPEQGPARRRRTSRRAASRRRSSRSSSRSAPSSGAPSTGPPPARPARSSGLPARPGRPAARPGRSARPTPRWTPPSRTPRRRASRPSESRRRPR